ncbi:MAG TPA: beta-ketoacyl-ACP synthase III [Thermoanaerobaculia bacterium]|nr:beta-ketoacyl-ACP synthase III [Thermoanaerobaculia bacterium]
MKRARVAGTGAAVPRKVLTNADLEKLVETSDEWIMTRTGIKERHIVSEGEKFSDLCTKAADQALKSAHVKPEDLDMILVGTISSDMPFPATSCLVQRNLGAMNAAASDLSAACVGFLYGLHMADALIQSNKADNILVVGGEILSRYVDWTDRSTCVLFGDGAGAVVLQATKGDHGILGSLMKSNGCYADFICMPGGGSNRPANDATQIAEKLPYIKMKGNETFKVAVKAMADVTAELLTEQGFTHEQIDLFIPHQANERIINAVGAKLKIAPGKVFKNIERYGNTSAASIPIALDECVREGRIHDGDLILLTAFGSGLVWGSVLLRW